jgi:hypothetical protein
MKFKRTTLFWDVKPLSMIEVHWHFTGIYCLHLEGKVDEQEAGGKQSVPLKD